MQKAFKGGIRKNHGEEFYQWLPPSCAACVAPQDHLVRPPCKADAGLNGCLELFPRYVGNVNLLSSFPKAHLCQEAFGTTDTA